ncbi:MAG: CDP-alcohol phosphatidyltransferase family protein [Chloroflexi bacterium]|nr:CDP-alcohol phosphatidyltransferase family protein [Chloroflexota bacterium]
MANLITLGRLVLLFLTLGLLYSGSAALALTALLLTIVIFAADGLDGWVARRRGSDSQFGAIFDIAGDRVVENAYWIVFANLQLVPVAFPLIVMTRGFAVDSLRSLSYGEGKTAFGSSTMMRSALTRWLTGSRFMRGLYGVVKAVAFCFLCGVVAAQVAPDSLLGRVYAVDVVRVLGWAVVYGTLALTIVRGLPVIYDSIDLFRGRA